MQHANSHTRIECVVIGHVQGVFFRDAARQKAISLDLTGFVKNVTDGTVFVVAEGPKKKLAFFLACLREGSRSAKVDEVQVEWKTAEGTFQTFEIG